METCIGFLRIPVHTCKGEKKKKIQTYLFVHRQINFCWVFFVHVISEFGDVINNLPSFGKMEHSLIPDASRCKRQI